MVRQVVDGTSSCLGLSRRHRFDVKELRLWVRLYDMYGEEVFSLPQDYDPVAIRYILRERRSGGLSLMQTCVRYKILRRCTLRYWERNASRYNNEQTMKKKDKAPKDSPAASPSGRDEELERLRSRVLELEAENAFLKKLRALMMEKRQKKG